MYIGSIFLFVIFTHNIEIISGYRILLLYPMPRQSHFKIVDRLSRALAVKGHQVDFVSPTNLESSNPNYQQVLKIQDVNNGALNSYNNLKSIKNNSTAIIRIMLLRCEVMEDPKFLNFARNPPKDPPYDLLVTTVIHPCYLILGYIWNIPVIHLSTAPLFPWLYGLSGNPENMLFSPNLLLIREAEGTDFWSRFYNTYAYNFVKWNYLYRLKDQDEIIKKLFGPNMPSVRDLIQNVSLTLVNSHFSIYDNVPTTSNVVEIGGIHIQSDDSEYTSSLKKWLDESKSGVVYFSLGSIYSLDTFPERISKIILASLEKINPIRVLMRVKSPEKLTVKIPDNVLIMSWIPQEKVLQHPNVKAFVTHGGSLGTQEAVHYGVPMLCVPYAFDQWSNCYNYVKRKIALKVDIESITEEEFDSALNEILNDPVYKKNVKKLSKIFRDRPMSPLDTAIFWIEYVIRYGKDTLRSPAIDLTWWQLALIDVYAVTIFGILVILITVTVIIKQLLRLLHLTKPNLKSLKDKQN